MLRFSIFSIFFLVQIKYDDNLWVYLKNFKNGASKLDLSDRIQILLRIGSAVEEIQKKGLVHLDLKPSNILIMYDTTFAKLYRKFAKILQNVTSPKKWNSAEVGNLVLADFGLSGDLGTCSKNAGTPGFASPEQMIGQVHQKSDLYALGKLAIMILFDWNTAWSLIAQPKTELELRSEGIYGTNFKKIIADFLKVWINKS